VFLLTVRNRPWTQIRRASPPIWTTAARDQDAARTAPNRSICAPIHPAATRPGCFVVVPGSGRPPWRQVDCGPLLPLPGGRDAGEMAWLLAGEAQGSIRPPQSFQSAEPGMCNLCKIACCRRAVTGPRECWLPGDAVLVDRGRSARLRGGGELVRVRAGPEHGAVGQQHTGAARWRGVRRADGIGLDQRRDAVLRECVLERGGVEASRSAASIRVLAAASPSSMHLA
jgi:hypothetical protein